MSEPLNDAASAAVIHVLETAAFMTVWPWQEADGDLQPPDTTASMTFAGPTTGILRLSVATDVLPLLTQNILGELEPGDSAEEKGRDALKEMLNMICGNLLTAWQGEAPVFNLSPPEIVDVTALAAATEQAAARIPFNLENTLAVLEVQENKI
ncbi:MAG TPA: chemotaxis protein CheX [bacterium]|jgi:CheY-specific phosphatase CheX